MDKTPRKPDRKFIQYPEIHPLLRTPDSKLICLPSATKNAWLRMLRSGDYTQGRSALRRIVRINEQDTEAFCCMGVYADLVKPTDWIEPTSIYSGSAYEWNHSRGTFPAWAFPESAKAAFQQRTISHEPPYTEEVYRILMKANDGQDAELPGSKNHIAPATFEQIALWIERYL